MEWEKNIKKKIKREEKGMEIERMRKRECDRGM